MSIGSGVERKLAIRAQSSTTRTNHEPDLVRADHRHRWLTPCLLLGTLLLAAGVRAWDMGAAYVSGDQAVMSYLIRHSYGVEWIVTRNYGPVTALFFRSWAELLSRLVIPMSEFTDRLPILLIGLAQVGITLPLLRRLRCTTGESLVGTLCCALLPTLVTDVRLAWAWGYLSIWLLSGTVALWATLAWLDTRQMRFGLIAALTLPVHCLSNTYAFALPATLLVLWLATWRRHTKQRPRIARDALLLFVLPCVTALGVILSIWWISGQGQIGHLLAKRSMGTTGLQLDQVMSLPAIWSGQFGYLFALWAFFGLILFSRPGAERKATLALWAWLGMLPVVFLADWDCIGYPAAYLIETAFAAGLLGVCALGSLWRRFSTQPWGRLAVATCGALCLGHMALGTADDCIGQGQFIAWTGIANKPSEMRIDIGAKAAGWYVREHVPATASILSLHTNKGLESSVAEYYCGRRILAGYDMIEADLPAIRDTIGPDVDVVIVADPQSRLLDSRSDFERVCEIRHEGQCVLRIYARPDLDLPRVDGETCMLNACYDRQYQPRKVPIALPNEPDFDIHMAKYQELCRNLRDARRLRSLQDDTIH